MAENNEPIWLDDWKRGLAERTKGRAKAGYVIGANAGDRTLEPLRIHVSLLRRLWLTICLTAEVLVLLGSALGFAFVLRGLARAF